MKKLPPKVKTLKRSVKEAYRVPDFSKPFNLSCPDWEKRIKHRKSLMPTGLLAAMDQERGALALRVFNKLRLPDVAEKPPLEEAVGESFKEIVQVVFGAWNGLQRAINEFFILEPKKNSKTTNAAG